MRHGWPQGWRAEAHAVLPTGGTSDWNIEVAESWHLTAAASSSNEALLRREGLMAAEAAKLRKGNQEI